MWLPESRLPSIAAPWLDVVKPKSLHPAPPSAMNSDWLPSQPASGLAPVLTKVPKDTL
jgi:hypothetical protein